MSIGTINLGAAPNDGNGDPARTAFGIHNSNFTDSANMASKLAQTDPLDSASGRGLLTGAFGVGTEAASLKSDADTITDSGDYRVSSGSTNIPLAQDGNISHYAGFSVAVASQVLQYTDSNSIFWRRRINSTTWGAWNELFSTSNLNVNEFTSAGAGEIIARGYASTTLAAHIFLPLNSITDPLSITVTGTFSVHNALSAQVGTAIVPALNAASSAKLALLTLAFTTPVTIGDPLTLRSIDATSKIKVNF